MLAYLCRSGAMPVELHIETIYSKGNSSSHFDPVLESLRIYLVLARILLSSIRANESRIPMGLR